MDEYIVISPTIRLHKNEVKFDTMRSSKPGGQHANKVETAVSLRFDIKSCTSLSEENKAQILESGDNRINERGVLMIKSQSSRSQFRNKQIAIRKLIDFIFLHTRKRKARKPTRRTKASKLRMKQSKTKRSQLKKMRRRPSVDH